MSRKELDLDQVLKEHPEWANWTYDDFSAHLCQLQAEIEDAEVRRTNLYRSWNLVAPYDAKLFVEVGRGFSDSATIPQVMEFIRLKKRRGHKQQEALDIYDAHYARRKEIVFPDDYTVDRIEATFEKREAERAAKKPDSRIA